MDIDQAKKDVNELFKDLAPMVDEIVSKYSVELDKIIKKLSKAETLTNEELRNNMLALSIESYLFGMSKDASILKQECATTLMKEAQAKAYNSVEGTQVVRNNQSLIETLDKQVINLVYNAVGNLMKTKLDEAHRMINVLNSILISRNAEAKIAANQGDDQQIIPQRQILNE